MTDAPMPLEAAVRAFFPHGGATKATLLAAIRAGALGFEKVGRAYLVTQSDIEAWRAKCREEAKGRVSGSVSAKAVNPSMSSGTERTKSALAAASMISAALKKPSRNTLPARSGSIPENVISLELQLQKS